MKVFRIGRRSFVRLFSALSTTAAVSPSALAQTSPQQSPPATPSTITREMLKAAEQIIGVDFTEAQENMALQNVNRQLGLYDSLRKLDVPLDTEPAISFRPLLPGRKVKQRGTKPAPAKTAPLRFTNIEDLAFFTVPQLAELIRTKKVSPVELTRMYLDRLKRIGPKLLCVVTLTEELAMKQAQDAEREIKSGKYRGSLHGIPWGAKDLFATKGIKTTWGAEPYRDQMIDHDAAVVERLRDAGAILLAKLSMGALAQGGRWFEGMTRNPWQPEETQTGSSGSSAGSASATSAGLVGFAIGTETLGSIISPSTRCGVVGLRPTYGRVSRYGAMGLSWTMDKIGPICRGVEDCALVLDAIYGPDGRDLTVGDAPFGWDPKVPLSQMRIAYLKSEFEQGAEDRKKLLKDALDVLTKLGAKLEPIELPKFPTTSLRIILTAEAATAFDDITRDGRVNTLSGQLPGDWPNTFRTARFIPAVEYLRAQRARTLLMQEMDKLMSNWDVFVCPPSGPSLTVTNLTGHPSVVVPCGFAGPLPQSIVFTGGLYDEGAPLRVALAYEQATQWHTMHPKV